MPHRAQGFGRGFGEQVLDDHGAVFANRSADWAVAHFTVGPGHLVQEGLQFLIHAFSGDVFDMPLSVIQAPANPGSDVTTFPYEVVAHGD